MTKRNERGFRTTSKAIVSCHQAPVAVRLTQSSSIEKHEHIWVFLDGECVEHLGKHQQPAAHLSLKAARVLLHELADLIIALERGR